MAFKFKQFEVKQEKSAMKIGTDAVILGAFTKTNTETFSILDIGSGTGVIALMLAQKSNAEVVDAIEIEEGAYEECVENFENSPWGDRLFCYHASVQEFASEIEDKYDLIVSNPPYVRNLEKKKMQNNVLNFEPELALFVEDDDPLVFYRAILKFAHNTLVEKGKIYFEINECLYTEMKALLISNGYVDIVLKKDFFWKI